MSNDFEGLRTTLSDGGLGAMVEGFYGEGMRYETHAEHLGISQVMGNRVTVMDMRYMEVVYLLPMWRLAETEHHIICGLYF